MTADDESALCTACGLCCDGTLFRFVKTNEAERTRLERIGLAIDQGDPPRFRQPCVKLIDLRCSIYAERPAVCRSFACALLERVRIGEVPIATAHGVVATARKLRDKAAPRGDPAPLHEIADRGERRATAERQLYRTILSDFLTRHFRKRGGGASDVADPAARR